MLAFMLDFYGAFMSLEQKGERNITSVQPLEKGSINWFVFAAKGNQLMDRFKKSHNASANWLSQSPLILGILVFKHSGLLVQHCTGNDHGQL
jgi:hypothetical protein